jgi:hypothetical protein
VVLFRNVSTAFTVMSRHRVPKRSRARSVASSTSVGGESSELPAATAADTSSSSVGMPCRAKTRWM